MISGGFSGVARRLAVVPLVAFALVLALAGAEAATSPAQWVKAFWPTARAAGISRTVYDTALANFKPDPEVLAKANNQAEFRQKLWLYLNNTVTEKRVAEGKRLLAANAATLARIESRYGVDRYVVVAIWGMESSFGAALNDPDIVKGTIRSLATLAYQGGSRAKFGRQQLIVALKIVQHGDIPASKMTGSWAGAMGHTQFIPTTYSAYAVDFNGDGRRDIWNTVGDALASTANYLKKSGWQAGATWGYEVTLPKGFKYKSYTARERSLGAWQKLGVTRAGGAKYPRPAETARLFAPAGTDGPVFLLVRNFRVIKHYNNADAYAMAVGHLSDRLRGGGGFRTEWPDADLRLSDSEKEKLQRLLTERGLYDGDVDGNIGSGSRAAIMAYQEKVGMTADGIESQKLLQLLEAGR